MTLAIQFAMAGEAEAFLSRGTFQKRPAQAPFDFQLYQDTRRDLFVAFAGPHPRFKVDSIGSVAAALLTHHVLDQLKPRRLINAGTAGGFESRGGKIGDLYLGDEVAVFHDRRIQLEGFDAMGRGHFPIECDRVLAQRLGFKVGIVSSGDSLDCTPEDARQLTALGASVKEMEAASIAWVCERHRVPLVLLKAVTDLVDHREATATQFNKNYTHVVQVLADGLERLVEALA